MKIIIIGSGPNGIFSAAELKKVFPNCSITIFEQADVLNNLNQIPNVAWHSTMSDLVLPCSLNDSIDLKYRPRTNDLISYYSHFISENNLDIRTNCKAILVGNQNEKAFVDILELGELTRYYSDYIIIATGIYSNNRTWNKDSNSILIKRFIDITLRNKNLVLVGGGNSAIDFIIYLLPHNKIHWIIRDKTWAPIFSNVKPQFDKILKKYSSNIEMHFNTEIDKIDENSSILLKNGSEIKSVDEVCVLIGYNSINTLFTNSGITYENECIKTNDDLETSIENIYVFGSIAAKFNGVSSSPTFISNGNKDKLNLITTSIKKKIIENKINIPILSSHVYVKNILIVVHPDDELFWAYELLRRSSDLLVICLTNFENKERRNAFIKVMDIYQCDYEIYNFKDRGVEGFSEEDLALIEKKISPIVNANCIDKIYTHNPDGDYGHPSHAAISYLIQKNIIDKSKIYFFTFGNIKKDLSIKEIKSLEIYFPKLNFSNFFKYFSLSIIEFFVQLKCFIRNRKFNIYEVLCRLKYGKSLANFNNDFEHIQAMRYSEFVNYCEYKRPFEQLSLLYKHWKVPQNSEELYNSEKSFYDIYFDRKYLITEFLPNCHGLTLSVGCHSYNRYDAYCLKNPENYVTIDLNPSYKVYGSPYEHLTGDFLSHQRLDKDLYQNIILFGVLGIPNIGFNDNYTLFNLEELAINHADSILNVDGLLLIGPDISLNKNSDREAAIKYWFDIAERVKILKSRYSLIHSLIAKTNIILVFKKKTSNE